MKTIYKCEICGTTSEDIDKIIECESIGVCNDLELPMYVIVQDNFCGKDKMTFAIANYRFDRHWYHVDMWACRDTSNGDNLSTFCSGGQTEYCSKDEPFLNPEHLCFSRYYQVVRSITPPTIIDKANIPVAKKKKQHLNN
jgi:hypothetical protein